MPWKNSKPQHTKLDFSWRRGQTSSQTITVSEVSFFQLLLPICFGTVCVCFDVVVVLFICLFIYIGGRGLMVLSAIQLFYLCCILIAKVSQ